MSFQVAFVFMELTNEYIDCLAPMPRGDWI
jgi:hypothetical protein